MMESEEILKSIKNEMAVKEKEFNEVISELNTLEQNYVARKTQLESSKEQIRGAYTALYRQLEKFSKEPITTTTDSSDTNKSENTKSTTSQTNIVTTKPVTQKTTSKKADTKQPDTTNATTNSVELNKNEKSVVSLTPEEIAKINKTIPKASTTDSNGNEIPDYLQSEYNK